MASQVSMEKIAEYAFMAFVIIAIVAGLAVGSWEYNTSFSEVQTAHSWILLVMLILGIIVGLISITTTEVHGFLMATVALIVASISNVWEPLGVIHAILPLWANYILSYIVAFVAPAAVILAIRGIFALARKK